MQREAELGALSLGSLHSGVALCVILDDPINQLGSALLILTSPLTAALTASPMKDGDMVGEHDLAAAPLQIADGTGDLASLPSN